MYYYKVVSELFTIGQIIDTNNCINEYRVVRNNELKSFFEKVYQFSINHDLPIFTILSSNYMTFKLFWGNLFSLFSFIDEIRQLKKEWKKINFQFSIDANFFIDFMLEKCRNEIQKEKNIVLPSRFKSSFFFETESDSKNYKEKFQHVYNLEIIKVEFLEERILKKFDNNLISNIYFLSSGKDYEKLCQSFLNGYTTDNLINEIVFQGKYKIISYIN